MFLRTVGLLCVLVFLSSTILFASTGDPKKDAELAEAAFKAGNQMVEQGSFDPAVDLYNKALSLKKDKRYYIALGDALRDVERKLLAFFAYKNALAMIGDKDPEKDKDHEGLVVLIVSLGLDLHKYDVVREYLPALEKYSPSIASSARTRLLLQMGHKALTNEQYTQAYRYFAKARKVSQDKRAALDGCRHALNGAAEKFSKEGRFAKSLSVLLRLYRLSPDEDVAIRVQGAFIRAGRPKKFEAKVKEILKSQRKK